MKRATKAIRARLKQAAGKWLQPRKFGTVVLCLFAAGIMTVLVSNSVTLYRLFCQATGYGGSTQRTAAVAVHSSQRTVVVDFDTNVAPDLPWEFKPEVHKVTTHLGQSTLVWFGAKNLGHEPIVGRATYNVTPGEAGLYFYKTECFCFTSERLQPGESARMPVVFYIDPEFEKDADTSQIKEVTLSYTFFRFKDTESARDLGTAAATAQEQLKEVPSKVIVPSTRFR